MSARAPLADPARRTGQPIPDGAQVPTDIPGGGHGPPPRSLVMRTIRLAWEASPRHLLMVMALTVMDAAAAPVLVVLSRHLVDSIARLRLASLSGRDVMRLSVALGILSAARRLLQGALASRQELFTWRVVSCAERRFLQRTARCDAARLDQPAWHDLATRVSRELTFRPTGLIQSLIGLVGAVVLMGGMLGLLVTLDWTLLVAALTSVLVYPPLQRAISRRTFQFNMDQSQRERRRLYYRWLLSDTRPAKDLRAFVLEDEVLGRHQGLVEQRHTALSRLHGVILRLHTLAGLISGLALAAAYLIVAERGIAGKLSPGDVTALIAAITSLTSQMNALSAALIGIDQHALFLAEFYRFLELEPCLPVASAPRPIPRPLKPGLELEDVTFTFPGRSEPALRGISLRVSPGEMLALVGANGAGKTTLLKLLLRFYDPQAGAVRMGGVDLRDADPVEVRQRVGILFQDYTNFLGSARESVGMGRASRQPDDIALWGVLRAACAEDAVKRLPGGLDSVLGAMFEGGRELSGGEWQRLALARLMFRDAEVWILDEPTASLDPKAEAAVFAELRRHLGGRIAIVISHRLSAAREADRIAVLDRGCLEELGSHDELLAAGGRYAELFELQAKAYR